MSHPIATVRRHADTAAPGNRDAPDDLVRDEQGRPLQLAARSLHIVARSAYFEAITAESDAVTAAQLVHEHDREDPAFFVEWYRSREE